MVRFLLLLSVSVLAAFGAVFFGVGLLLADRWEVATTQVVPAEQQQVLAVVSDLGRWREWCTMDAVMGPNTERHIDGAPGQVGSRIRWRGARGEALLTLTSAGPEGLRYEFALAGQMPLGSGAIELRPLDQGTAVTWRDQGRFPTLAARWVGWFGALQEAVRTQQEQSLGNLVQLWPQGGVPVKAR